MTHLIIKQDNGIIEQVSPSVIEKLYEIVHSGNLDSCDLVGSLNTTSTYLDYVDYLEELFTKDGVRLLIINATKKYIMFADPEIRRVFANTFGDNVGVTKSDLSGITKIPNRMFEGNTAITSFDELGDLTNITELDYYCFNAATNLRSIDLSNIKIVRQGALCSVPLEVINLPKATFIEDVFGSSVLREVNIGSEVPDNLKITSIPNAFLRDHTSVTTVTGLKMVTEIGNFGFGNTRLSEVDTTSNLTTIGTAAFWLTKIKCIDLSGVTTLSGDSLFSSCSELIDLSTSDQTLINTGAVTYTFNWGTIPKDLFYGCKLTNKSFNFPNATNIGNEAFRLSGVVGINSPNVTSVDNNAFSECSSLTTINLSNCTSIGERAFWKCTSLTSVDLSNITIISAEVFWYCSSLTSVGNISNCTSIGRTAFAETALTAVDVSNVTVINDYVFANCPALTTVGDLSNCTSIGTYAFWNCTSLTTVNLSNVTSIGGGAFQNCTSLTSVGDLSSCTSIGAEVFWGCTLLTTIGDISNVTTIGRTAFADCKSLTTVSLSNITTIEEYVFSNCTALTSVNLSNVTTINNYVFKGCTSLTTITMPSTITSYGNDVFYECSVLQSIYFTSLVPATITQNSFRLNNAILYVPSLALEAYKTAPVWKDYYLNRIQSYTLSN